jgi:hypothetical protein
MTQKLINQSAKENKAGKSVEIMLRLIITDAGRWEFRVLMKKHQSEHT